MGDKVYIVFDILSKAAIIAAGIFVFTSIVFLVYDRAVELRQRSVMSQATQSSEMVASLFPKAVRDRLYQEAKEKKEKTKKKRLYRQASQTDVGGLAAIAKSEELTMGAKRDPKTRPIADLCKLLYKKLCTLRTAAIAKVLT